jgi:hypothetical protein
MSAIIARLANEPVLVTTFVTAVLDAAIAFGAPIADGQKIAVITVVTAALAFFARSKVSPTP